MIFRFAFAVCLPALAVEFTDVTAKAGLAGFVNQQGSPKKDYILDSVGGGAAWIDYDRDGWIDALLVSGGFVCALFRNQGDGTFRSVPLPPVKGRGMGVTVADYDRDGWDDFLITGYGRNWLFRNRKGRDFEEVAERAGLLSRGLWSTGAAFFDSDNDGNPDLFVSRYVKFNIARPVERNPNCQFQGKGVFCGPQGFQSDPHSLYRNNGNGTFSDVSQQSGIRAVAGPHHGMGVLPLDYDNDGRIDIYVANDDTPNQLWHNLGGGKFADVAVEAGVAFSPDGLTQSSMGVDAGDLFHRGVQDVFVTTFAGQPFPLYKGRQDGAFEDITWASGVGRPTMPSLGWGAHFFDIDLDGWLDIFLVNGHVYPEMSDYRQRPQAFRNLGNGKFEEWPLFPTPLPARGSAVGDFDNDGDLDILVNNMDAAPVLYENVGKPRAHWIAIAVPAGSKVSVRAAGVEQFRETRSASGYLSASDGRAHFGLGAAGTVDEIRIVYPNGKTRTLRQVKAGQILLPGDPP